MVFDNRIHQAVREDGRRAGVVETFETAGGTLTSTIDWDYDRLGRLIVETFDSSDNSLDYRHEYVYDLAGNRDVWRKYDQPQGTLEETVSYDYDENDRLETETSSLGPVTTYTYTGTQQASKTVTNGAQTTLEVTYEYNLQGRLAKVTSDDGTTETVTEYEYDTDGVRVKQTVTVDAGTPVVTEYLIDARNHTGYAKALAEYVDGVLDTAYTIGHEIISQTDGSGNNLFLVHDGHGSTRQLVDETASAGGPAGIGRVAERQDDSHSASDCG